MLQQYGSWLQIEVTHESQPFLSFAPLAHSLCVQVEPPPHDWWHTDETSPTQIESHAVVQQYESAAQISPAHVSHEPSSSAPVEQIG